MSNIQLHSPLVSFVNVDSLPFRSAHTRPSTSTSSSAPQVINLVDDDADTNAPPPAVRRRLVGTVPDDDDVIIVDPDTSAETSTSGRRISVGAINRPIVIADSDEEHSPTRNAPSGRSTQQYQRRDSFRIFSPPPPAYHPIPPVPSLPIIANPQPFAILAPSRAPEDSSNNNTSSRRRLPFDEPPQPSTSSASASASRRGSNRPGIQLGGGLVSQNIRPRRGAHWSGWPGGTQSNDMSRHNGSSSSANAGAGSRAPPVGRYIATFLNHDPQHDRNLNPDYDQRDHDHDHDHDRHHADHAALRRYEAGGWFNPRRAGRTLESAFYFLSRNIIGTAAAAAAVTSVPEYTKDMTHPGLPPPGWSFSFGTESVQSVDVDVDDDEGDTGGGGGGTTAPAEYLACALCLDPLHANVDERRDLSVEEKRKKRVWALRCGHMFDGKCIEGLMVPNWQKEKPKMTTTTTTTTTTEEKKEEEKEEDKAVVLADDEPVIDKGKGKAKEEDEDAAVLSVIEEVTGVEPVSTPVNIVDDTPPSSQSQPESTSGSRYNFRARRPPPPPQEQPASSRSNRRNRAGTASASAAASASASEEPSRKPRGTKRKYDGKAVKNNEPPKIEIRYNWTCPVAGCGKMHSSYKLQDVWKPDEESGPIAIYI